MGADVHSTLAQYCYTTRRNNNAVENIRIASSIYYVYSVYPKAEEYFNNIYERLLLRIKHTAVCHTDTKHNKQCNVYVYKLSLPMRGNGAGI